MPLECDTPGGSTSLTRHQREVAHLLAEDLGIKEVARRLELGVKTVETRRSSATHKLEARSMVGLAHYAPPNKLTPL